jgi:magnesium-protoporphyrin IX monomethyl ester (oxidative) cyclase
MRADPKLLSGGNRLWIKFFLLSVYATMYVRDHARPAFHAALGLDPTEYDYTVFRICSQISRQVFPLTVDIDNPSFRADLDRLARITAAMSEATKRGGLAGGLRKALLCARAAITFMHLYLLPAQSNAVPASVRLAPAW